MKPWIDRDEELSPALAQAQSDAALAILEAETLMSDNVSDMILFDLQTSAATRFVAMPVYHVHGQDCGRA